MTPKISVVISTWNRPDRLKVAIDSVDRQSLQPEYVTVVHDGPIPTELDELFQAEHKAGRWSRVFLYDLPEHFGSDTKPKNWGIHIADKHGSDYVAFLDDDNQWRPDHLAALHKALEGNPACAVAYGDRWVIDEREPDKSGRGVSRDFKANDLIKRNFIDTSDVLIRKDALFSVGGFDERYRKYVDWNFWVRLHKAGFEFFHVPLIMTDYHITKDAKSSLVKTEAEQLFMKENDGKFINIPDWDPLELEIEQDWLGTILPPRVAIFSLTYNRLEYTKQAFDSLYKTAGYEFDHFVVDNGSKDGTVDWLLERATHPPPLIFPTFNTENKGISKASNQALDNIAKVTPYDIIGKVDNDCLFQTQDWLKRIVELWQKNHRFVLSPYVSGLRDNPGGASREAYGQLAGQLLGMTRHVGGICVFADTKLWQDFRHDEESFLHGEQDLEFSTHARMKGYQPAYLENVFVSHGPQGTAAQEQDYPHYFEKRAEEKRTRYKEDDAKANG